MKTLLPEHLLGDYLNPDEIEKMARAEGSLEVSQFGVANDANAVLEFFQKSPLLLEHGHSDLLKIFGASGRRLVFEGAKFDSYFASVFVDFVRRQLIAARASFTFETVMSHPSKVDLLREAREKGYRTYLYYIATNDPDISVARAQSCGRRGTSCSRAFDSRSVNTGMVRKQRDILRV